MEKKENSGFGRMSAYFDTLVKRSDSVGSMNEQMSKRLKKIATKAKKSAKKKRRVARRRKLDRARKEKCTLPRGDSFELEIESQKYRKKCYELAINIVVVLLILIAMGVVVWKFWPGKVQRVISRAPKIVQNVAASAGITSETPFLQTTKGQIALGTAITGATMATCTGFQRYWSKQGLLCSSGYRQTSDGSCRREIPIADKVSDVVTDKWNGWNTPQRVAGGAVGIICGGEFFYQLVDKLSLPKSLHMINPWYYVRTSIFGVTEPATSDEQDENSSETGKEAAKKSKPLQKDSKDRKSNLDTNGSSQCCLVSLLGSMGILPIRGAVDGNELMIVD